MWEISIGEEAFNLIYLPSLDSGVNITSLFNLPRHGLCSLNDGIRGRGETCEICGLMVIPILREMTE